MSSPNPRSYVNQSKPGGWFSAEDFLNELTVFILSSSTIKSLAVSTVDSNGVTVGTLGTATVVGQVVIAVTGTRIQLPSSALYNGVILTAISGNTASMTLGGSSLTNTVDGTGNGYILSKGSSISAAVDNTNRLYVNGTAGDILTFIGS